MAILWPCGPAPVGLRYEGVVRCCQVLSGVCSARMVSVSSGPLVRVEGQPVSIRCTVSDYEGPREQDFEWTMQRGGGVSIEVISTFDIRFSDASLGDRVAAGDVAVERLADSVVELRIGEVRRGDGGVYSCHTPSTDSVIRGTYKAGVALTVIPDTLKVIPAPVPPVVPEGSDITLSCTVTRELPQPTFLSVSWSLRKGSSPPEEVLTLGPQGGVATGPGYAQRYAAGGLRLAPGQDGLFNLVLTKVTAAADQGAYVCTGRQWTHEDGESRSIVERRGEMGQVTVTPTGESLKVNAASSSPAPVSVGRTLSLLCRVEADNLAHLALAVTWLRDGRHIIAVMDRNGVVAPTVAASNRSSGQGEVGLERIGTGQYQLVLRAVAVRDSGAYTCRVRAFIETAPGGGEGGRWYQAAEKISAPVTVRVSQIKPGFSLALSALREPQAAAQSMELACHVTNITHLPPGGLLGVTWEHTPPGTPPPGTPPHGTPPGADLQSAHTIGSLDFHGNLQPGAGYSDRLDSGVMSLTRVHPETFKLHLLRTQEGDMGQYMCRVSAWMQDQQGSAGMLAEYLSAPLPVVWTPKRPSLSVAARRVREASVGGATFEMSCSVASQNLGEAGYSVLVQSQESTEGDVRTIMTLSPDNVLQHRGGTAPQRRDSLMLTKSGPLDFSFRLAGVQLADRGFYWCDVSAWTKQPGQAWTQVTRAESNKVKIDFQENGPSFTVAIQSDTSSVFPWETAKMECSLSVSGSSSKSDDVAYEVSWFFTRLRGGGGGGGASLLAAVDRYGVVRKDRRNSSSDVSVERRHANTFQLSVHGTQDSDSGEYHCSATPWYLSASTGAWTQAQPLHSAGVFLTVRFAGTVCLSVCLSACLSVCLSALWESLKLPLLYGAAASLGVGLFSLVLGLVCAHCCCRNTMHTPRSRSKLMDLEMD
ncbi:Prostaglandin F2 receptor negative regulator [Merluccius polli]|uniref:Prostaglandin F2 receptor negative regulator n=1 Tax=Merluccius polli TaxID=89951 RepID=A0AA47MNJ3_MERPO|nr:Prostaglandin F2 receptor negative regulator [Merluccius polli]